MKKKKAIIITAGVLFVSVNLFLSLKEGSKVERSSYIPKWEQTKREDLRATMPVSGMITPMEEHYVYYNGTPDEFKEFLVNKGDKVEPGSPLYKYSSKRFDSDRQKMEGKKLQLVREATMIDEQIKQLQFLQSVSASTENEARPVNGSATLSTDTSKQDLISVSIEKEVLDLQKEKGHFNNEIQKYDDILKSYTDKEQISPNGDVTGFVKRINYELKNPIMTIISDKPKVEGTFSEDELNKVKEGMEVMVTSDLFKGKLDGTLTKIAKYPEKTPSEKKESHYPFEIKLNENEHEIFYGNHVNVSIVTAKVLNTTTLSEISVLKKAKNSDYVYVLNSEGLIEKRNIKKGLSLNGRIEVQQGIKTGEIIALDPNNVKKVGEPFFTPLNLENLSPKSFSKESKIDILKEIVIGFSKK
ncbi:hypothetical protein BIV60_12145 [Bacillus sp. MUM 116]|uniref:efflux RND transporter periplasmic adaptor subunit n=1 Tax=Bacillus sp. MUM 116 TaxID=1678002 RepID=UPI0008F5E799|nr:HlyD family secretion protein [Bacillus sp. MUM 116]OIK14251.1 hypothetical protein BIV60_12145 [Bacillus sp. MUM 116]